MSEAGWDWRWRRGEEEELKKDPRIILQSVALVGEDGKKYVCGLKEGDSFAEVYWSLAYEACGLRAERRKPGREAKRGKVRRPRGKRQGGRE